GHSTGLTVGPAFSIPTKKLAMWLFIIADTMTFAACLVAYGFVRNGTPNWPRPFPGITSVALMTFVLLTSSLTMLFGLRSARAGDKRSEEHTSELQSLTNLVCRLLLENKKLRRLHRLHRRIGNRGPRCEPSHREARHSGRWHKPPCFLKHARPPGLTNFPGPTGPRV